MVNFGIEMFRTYGTQDLVVDIPVRHMNVTAKDNALISETAYSWRYPLPFAFRLRRELSRTATDIKAIMKTVRAEAFSGQNPLFGRNRIRLQKRSYIKEMETGRI